MNQIAVSPSMILLMAVFFSIFIALPLGAWLLFVGRPDARARLCFFGIALLSLGMSLIVFRPYLHAYISHQVAWILTLTSCLVMIIVFRGERREQSIRLYWIYCLLLAWIVYQTWLYHTGLTESLGLASHAGMMVLSYGLLGIELYLLNRRRMSKSLILLMLSVALFIIPNFVRVASFIQTGEKEVMDVFKFSWQANFFSISSVFAVMLMCFGYWGFALEKSNLALDKAKASEEIANRNLELHRQLLTERDHLLMVNSRFASISALTSFLALLIHDLSQPLQALQLGLEQIRSSVSQGNPREKIDSEIKYLEQVSDRAAHLVTALRSLTQTGEDHMESFLVTPFFGQICDVLQSEGKHQQVEIRVENHYPNAGQVLADRTMLQHIVFNFVSNSLQQFKVMQTKNPRVLLSLQAADQQGQSGVMIEVEDNAGGFPAEFLARQQDSWSSQNPDRMGLALILSKQLLGSWGGSVHLANGAAGEGVSRVQIWLPTLL